MLGYSPQGGSTVLQKKELVLVMELGYKNFVVYVGMYVRMLKLRASNKYTILIRERTRNAICVNMVNI